MIILLIQKSRIWRLYHFMYVGLLFTRRIMKIQIHFGPYFCRRFDLKVQKK